MRNNMSPNWSDSEKFVETALARNEAMIRDLSKKMEKSFEKFTETHIQILTELAKLKVKSGIWGIIGGSLPVLVGLAIYLFKSQF